MTETVEVACGSCPETFRSDGATYFEAFHAARRRARRHAKRAHPTPSAPDREPGGPTPPRGLPPRAEEINAR